MAEKEKEKEKEKRKKGEAWRDMPRGEAIPEDWGK